MVEVGGKKSDSDTSIKRQQKNSLFTLTHLRDCELQYVGVGSVSGRSGGHLYLHNLSSYKCCNSYVVACGRESAGGTLDPQKPSVSLALCDIWHLHGSPDKRCELQNGPAWFLRWHQSPFQIPDWLIPLANP